MKIAPQTLERGERYGTLTVLRKVSSDNRGPRYQCGCDCGVRLVFASAGELMRGEVKCCRRCQRISATTRRGASHKEG